MRDPLRTCICALLIAFAWSADVYAQARPNKAQVYEIGKACYDSVNKDRAARKDASRWDECITIFTNLAQSKPGTEEGARAAYSAARLSKEKYGHVGGKTNLEGSIAYYNGVVNGYPNSKLADDALLQIAIIRADRMKQPDRARKALTAIIDRYPTSDSAAAARDMLARMDGKKTPSTKAAEEMVVEEEVITYERTPGSDKSVPERSALATLAGDPFAPASSKNPGYLLDVKHARKKSETKVTLSFSRPVDYQATFTTEKRKSDEYSKLSVLLEETHLSKNLRREIAVNTSTVRGVSVKPRILGGTLVDISLEPATDYAIEQHAKSLDVTFRKSAEDERERIARARIQPSPTAAATATELVEPASLGDKNKGKKKSFFSKLAFWKQKDSKDSKPHALRIVIDPGHGGDEKGAVGPHGVAEKTVVMSIAEKLADQLAKELGAEVWLTRDKDKTVSLEKRFKRAKRKNADLFISVHANASSDPKHAGVETYFLNNATDEAAMKLAARENESWRGPRSDIDQILATMLQNAITDDSRELATEVQDALVKNLSARYKGVRNRKARSALFYVLVGTECPSILVETSFITNPREEMRLADPTYQQIVAASIADGVKQYVATRQSAVTSL